MTNHPAPADASPPPSQAAPPSGGNLLHDVFLLYFNPSRLFANLPRVDRSVGALILLLLLQALGGWILLSTGVYDYETAVAAECEVFQFAKQHEGDDDPNVADEGAAAIEKSAVFQRSAAAVGLIGGGALNTLLTVGLLAGVLFSVVALRGGKPKFALLAGIVAFASYVELPRLALRVFLVWKTHAGGVDTSAAALPARLGQESGVSLLQFLLLRRLEPFDLWFWILFALGARLAARLSVRTAAVTTIVLATTGALFSCTLDLLKVTEFVITFNEESKPAPTDWAKPVAIVLAVALVLLLLGLYVMRIPKARKGLNQRGV